MQPIPLVQPSFAGGELDPLLIGRVDVGKYKVGLATCQNFLPMVGGGVTKRPPTMYVAPIPTVARLIPFIETGTDKCVLAFTNYKLRIVETGGTMRMRDISASATYEWHASGVVSDAYYLTGASGAETGLLPLEDLYDTGTAMAVGTLLSLAASQYAWGDADTIGFSTLYARPASGVFTAMTTTLLFRSPYSLADMQYLSYAQSNGKLHLAHINMPPYKLTRVTATDWEFRNESFLPKQLAPTGLTATPANFTTPAGSGPYSRTVSYTVSAVNADGAESLPCTAVDAAISWPWSSGAKVTLAWTAPPGAVRYNIYKNSRGEFGWIGNASTAMTKIATATTIKSTEASGHAATKAFDSDEDTYWESTEHGPAGLSGIAYIGQDYGSGVTKTVYQFRIKQGHVSTNQHAIASVKLEHSSDGTTWVTLETFTLDITPEVWQTVRLSSTTTPVAARYWRILANADTPSGYWMVHELEFYDQAQTSTFAFVDDYIEPDTSAGPITANDPFTGAGNYPSCVAMWKQRLWYAATTNKPSTVWATRLGSEDDMSVSFPGIADDGLEETLAESTMNPIRHLLPMSDMLVFTDVGVWTLPSEVNGAALSATNFDFKVNGGVGSCDATPPLSVNGGAVYVSTLGSSVRTANYSIVEDRYAGTDLSAFAKHMLRDRFPLGIAYADGQTPKVFIKIYSPPYLLEMTYSPEQEMVAWSWHVLGQADITNDRIYSVCSLQGQSGQGAATWTDDVLFMSVMRSYGGVEYHTIERMVRGSLASSVNYIDSYQTVNKAAWEWVQVGTSGRYYLRNSDAGHGVPGIASVALVKYLGVSMTQADYGSLAAGQYDFHANTVWVHLAGNANPNTVATGALTMTLWLTQTSMRLAGRTVRSFSSATAYIDAISGATGTIPVSYVLGANTYVIGLVYTAIMKTLPIDSGDDKKTVQTLQKKINNVTVKVYASRGGTLSPDDGAHTAVLCGITADVTGDVLVTLPQVFAKAGQLTITSADHYPMTILDIKPDVTFGG